MNQKQPYIVVETNEREGKRKLYLYAFLFAETFLHSFFPKVWLIQKLAQKLIKIEENQTKPEKREQEGSWRKANA
ncbi:hypothetical protein TSUD_155410 [Trifolium subterraneum]|uniref:Uncharacterized protein n=1 Tax=Trifolium subterraneum TaxID=3900 RepID=A0A2Z6NGH9_TRISU|nr:hypothetical protein TSUD_155410 [Trifolium subterraneum]